MKTRKSGWIILINILLILVIFGLSIYFLTKITTILGQIIVGLIPLITAISSAVLSNYYIKQNQLDFELSKQKINNYTELLNILCKYIRHPDSENDLIATITLKSWIYGNEEVIKQTKRFIDSVRKDDIPESEKKSDITENLKALLISIRKDIGKNEFFVENDLLQNLLPKPKFGSI